MSRRLLVSAWMLTMGLAVSATPAPAQDWWNPGQWVSPQPVYGYRTGYVPVNPSPVSPYGYSRGNFSNGWNGTCPNGTCGNRNTWMNAPGPGYRSAPPVGGNKSYVVPSYGSGNYRGPTSSRPPRYNPFYE